MSQTEQQGVSRITAQITVVSVGPTINISPGSMCILIADSFRVGTKPTLLFMLPDDVRPITCTGRIVWCRLSDINPKLFEVGLSFETIADEDRRKVIDFVATHVRLQR